jgi:hypothetical protein
MPKRRLAFGDWTYGTYGTNRTYGTHEQLGGFRVGLDLIPFVLLVP